MASDTNTPPEIKSDDLVQFVESHRPKLKAGDYSVSVDHSLSLGDGAGAERTFSSDTLDFTVRGDRLSLGEENFHALYPCPGSRGKYGHVLPHVILNRSTLPWERSPLGGSQADSVSPSWLALLVFAEDEIEAQSAHIVAAGRSDTDDRPGPFLADGTAVFPEEFELESGQHSDDRVSVIDVSWGLLKTLLPHYHDLEVTAHVRRVSPKTGQPGTDDGLTIIPAGPPADDSDEPPADTEDGPDAAAQSMDPVGSERALIFANRLPPGDKTCVVHLVSLEERYLYPEHLAELGRQPDHETVRTPIIVESSELAGWLRQGRHCKDTNATIDCGLHLIAGERPALSIAAVADERPVAIADAAELQSEAIEAMCHQVMGDPDSVWRTQMEQAGKVTFTAPFASEHEALGRIEVSIYRKGASSRSLGKSQIDDLLGHVPAFAGPSVPQLRVDFRDYTATLPDQDDAGALSNWVECAVRDQLQAEHANCRRFLANVTNGGEVAEAATAPAELLQQRQHLLGLIRDIKQNDLSDFQKRRCVALEERLAAQAIVRLGARGLDLEAALALSDTNQVTATLAQRVKPMAATFRFLRSEPVFDAQGADASKSVRLVSLKNWNFYCEAEKRGFAEELTSLNAATPRARGAETADHDTDRELADALIGSSEFHIPLDALSGDASGQHDAAFDEGRRYLRSGAVPLRHGLRGGGRTFSWYHGPFISGARAQASLNLPARGPDELLIYNESLGMLDVSYAAAWELGRMSILEDSHIAMDLLHWKQDHARTLAHARQHMSHHYLPMVQPSPDLTPPDSLAAFFRSLTLLEGVPFNYLIPDERLLPAESIRFFTVDSMWLECLRDGAFSVGRVLAKDHLEDIERGRELDPPPRLSGFLLRSKVVSDWPQLTVDAYSDMPVPDAAPENTGNSPNPLRQERFARLGPNVLLCLFSDPQRAGREIDRADLHLPAEVLHFGLEDQKFGSTAGKAKIMKQLRDPSSGEALHQVSWPAEGADQAGDSYGYCIDQAVLENLKIAGANPSLLTRLKAIVNRTFAVTARDFVDNHLTGAPSPVCAGLSPDDLDFRPSGTGETLGDLILKCAGPVRIRNQTVRMIPWRSHGAANVLDLRTLLDEVANRLAPVLPDRHRFTAADFSLQMLDLPPKIRFVRPANREASS